MIAFVHIIEISLLLDVRAHVLPTLAPDKLLQHGILGIMAYDVKILVQLGLAFYITILLIIGILVPQVDIPPVNEFPMIEGIFQDLLEAGLVPLPSSHGDKALFIEQITELIKAMGSAVVFVKNISEYIFHSFIYNKPLVLMIVFVPIGTTTGIYPLLHFILVHGAYVMADLVRQVFGHCLLNADHKLFVMCRFLIDGLVSLVKMNDDVLMIYEVHNPCEVLVITRHPVR